MYVSGFSVPNNLNNQIKLCWLISPNSLVPLFYKPTTTSPFYFNLQMADQQDLDRIQAFQSSLKLTSTQDWERSDKYHNSFLIPEGDVLDAL